MEQIQDSTFIYFPAVVPVNEGADCGVIGQSSSTKDGIQGLYDESMKTENEDTKIFLVALHYVNNNCSGREVMLNMNGLNITFMK